MRHEPYTIRHAPTIALLPLLNDLVPAFGAAPQGGRFGDVHQATSQPDTKSLAEVLLGTLGPILLLPESVVKKSFILFL